LKKFFTELSDIKLELNRETADVNHRKTKSYLIYDYPGELAPGFLYGLQHATYVGEQKHGRTDVSIGTIIRKAEVIFNESMGKKMDRLQGEINNTLDGKASSYIDPEKADTLDTLMEFRSGRSEFIELHFVVTISSDTNKALKFATKAFERSLKNFSGTDFKFKRLKGEQHLGLQATSLTGSAEKLLKRYQGRIMTIDSLAAFYPFVSGNFSDENGIYIGHRIDSALSVDLSFKKSADAQNMLVTGATGEGKSAFIKGLILGLLIAGYKIYIYDLDGEFREINDAYGGLWLDLTGKDAPFVDTTIIPKKLIDDVKDMSKLSKEDIMRINEVDENRYMDTANETVALISMICKKKLWDEDTTIENAAQDSLIKMWEDENVYRDQPETWDSGKPSFKKLYNKISEHAEDDSYQFQNGAKLLKNELWSYFEGLDSGVFENAIDSSVFKGYQLVTIRTISAGENPSPKDKRNATLKFNMAANMVWNQIKRDRLLKNVVSCEIFDEFQRAGNDESTYRAVYRGITTSRKFNSMVILGFNDPSILFAKRRDAEGNETSNKGLWENARHLVAFRLAEGTIDDIAKDGGMPEDVVNSWKNLPKYSFIFRTSLSNNKKAYDVLQMQLPEEELNLSKTREFTAA
jgi:hypothetical protein